MTLIEFLDELRTLSNVHPFRAYAHGMIRNSRGDCPLEAINRRYGTPGGASALATESCLGFPVMAGCAVAYVTDGHIDCLVRVMEMTETDAAEFALAVWDACGLNPVKCPV